MRLSDQDPSAEIPGSNSGDVNSSQGSQKDEPSSFSRTLAKKRDAHQAEPPAKPKKPAEIAGVEVPADLKGAQSRWDGSIPAERLAGTRAVEVPPELHQLIREISVVVNAPGNQQVHIELNSNVLQGLHIRIERQNGAVAIQFQSASAEVSRLLSNNVSALTQGLADRGVEVADIRVNSLQSLSSAPKYKGSNSERHGQGGRQGQRG